MNIRELFHRVVVYNNYPIDRQRLYHMLTVSNIGAEWIPQNIFLDGGLIYIIVTIVNGFLKI